MTERSEKVAPTLRYKHLRALISIKKDAAMTLRAAVVWPA